MKSFIATLAIIAVSTEAVMLENESQFFGNSDFFGDFSFASGVYGGMLPSLLRHTGSRGLQ